MDTLTKGNASARAAVLICAALFGGCVSSPRFTTRETPSSSASAHAAEPAAASPSVSTPAASSAAAGHSLLMTQGLASYYADDFNGKKTANGEIYDMYQLTAAHRSLPFGTKLRVTNLDNNKSVIVRITDRGPFVMDRILDLSLGAASQLQMLGVGVARVQLDVIEWGDNLYVK